MLSKENIKKVNAIILDKLYLGDYDINNIKPESGICTDLQADSLDCVELAMSLEDVFNIDIPDSAIPESGVTVQQLYDYIEKAIS